MKLVIATLLYKNNSLDYLEFFLNNLKSATDFLDFKYQIFFGDNSGPDLSNQNFLNNQSLIAKQKISYSHFITNLGFARAYNKLINQAFEIKAEYFLALNPDVLCSKESIAILVKAIEEDKDLASLSPKILVWDFKNKRLTTTIDSCGLIVKSGLKFFDLGQGNNDRNQYENKSIIGPSGAVALYRMSALEKVKENGQFFDENFFMYKEDCDLAYRLHLKNLKSKTISSSIFYHDRSVSGGSLFQRIKDRLNRSRQQRAWSFQGQVYIYKKHYRSQSFINKGIIILNLIKLFTYSLIFERFVFRKKIN